MVLTTDTLKVLNSLGVELVLNYDKRGFYEKNNNSKFEIAREDHSKIVSKFK